METYYSSKYLVEYWFASLPRMIKEFSDALGQSVIFAELDSHYPNGISSIFDYMASLPGVPYCDTRLVEPLLKVDGAGMAYIRNSQSPLFYDACAEFTAQTYVRKGPIYLADQLSRYRAVCIGKKKGWIMTDLNEFMEGRFRFFFKGEPEGEHPVPLEERWQARSNSKYRFGGMTSDKRIIWHAIAQEGQAQ